MKMETEESWGKDSRPKDQNQGWGEPNRERGGIKSIPDMYRQGRGADLGGEKRLS